MRFSRVSLVCSAVFGVALLSACSSDSEPEPAGQAGSAGNGGSTTTGGSGSAGMSSGGSAVGGSASGGGGSASGGTASGGSSNGGAAAGTAGKGDSGGSAGEPSGETVADCLEGATPGDTRTEALSFEGMGVKLGIVRAADPDSVGTSGTTPWLPERFALERGSVQACVSEAGSLEYESSHHNFDDSMTATRGGETWVFKQTREDYGKPTKFSVEGHNGQTVVWGPITLTLKSCERLDMAGSCLDFYQ